MFPLAPCGLRVTGRLAAGRRGRCTESLPSSGPRPAGTESLVCPSRGDPSEVGDVVTSSPASQQSSPATWADTRVCAEHTQLSVYWTRSRCFGWRADMLVTSLRGTPGTRMAAEGSVEVSLRLCWELGGQA